jgi:hypothetical protein
MFDAKQPIRAEACIMKVVRGVPGERKFSTKVRVKLPTGGRVGDRSCLTVAVRSGKSRRRCTPCMLPLPGPLPNSTPSPAKCDPF